MKTILIKRFLSFLQQIRKSNKISSKFLLESILLDTRSTTGSNLREILLLTDKSHVSELVPNDAFQVKYHPLEAEEEWKVNLIHEIIQIKEEQLDVPDFSLASLEELLTFLCTG